MIKTLTACTTEVDDTDLAVEEILTQLDPDANLRRHTVGMVTCYADFVTAGVVKALADALPFDVVGATTLGNAAPGFSDSILLTLTVLTSDDVIFSVGLTEPILSNDPRVLEEAYRAAEAALPAKPALMLSYAPLLMNVGGDYYVNTFNRVSGGVPNFGTITVDHNIDYHEARVLHNGDAYTDRYAFILLAGRISPRFFMASISSEKIFREKGVVTAAQDNQLQTVNGLPVVDYLQSLGLTRNADGTITGINSFPFIVDYNDGTLPVVRVMFALTPEGYAVCGGDIPVGATLSVGSIDAGEVVATTEKTLRETLESGPYGGLLMFSCVGRYFSLGYNPTSEIEKIQRLMEDSGIPYQFAYSGGELCPVYAQDGQSHLTNRNHNDTYIICAL
ncbi:MAG: FIST C-terminal domain-containing protein [Gracilibacteraceae bacterium]|jgi:hypothetical protein|nr:FIST C-terminal domain-containing protein [Gracilibacteraceae bacterium]